MLGDARGFFFFSFLLIFFFSCQSLDYVVILKVIFNTVLLISSCIEKDYQSPDNDRVQFWFHDDKHNPSW